MGWIERKSVWLDCPDFADVFEGRESFEGLQSSSIIVGVDEVVEMRSQLGMAVVMVSLDRRFLDCAVHPFDLAVGPGMLDLGQPVLDLMFVTDPVEDVVEGIFVVRHIGELDAVIGQHGVDCIGHSSDQIA